MSYVDVTKLDSRTAVEKTLRTALESYANVHRGSGPASMASSALLDHAREIILEHLGWNDGRHTVVFCTPIAASGILAGLAAAEVRMLSSESFGLPLGIRALAVETRALQRGSPLMSGGGTVRFVLPDRVLWAEAPERQEAGTPSVIHALALARAVQLRPPCRRGCASPPSDHDDAGRILHDDGYAALSGRELLRRLGETAIGHGTLVPTSEGPRPYINLDNAASTQAFAPIWDAARAVWRLSAASRCDLIEKVRALLAAFLGAPSEQYDILFTSNTTEAINLAARGLDLDNGGGRPAILTTMMEHHSNDLPWRQLPDVDMVRLPVDDDGFVDLFRFEELLDRRHGKVANGKGRFRLVAVSGASNVLGTFQDIDGMSRLAHRHGVPILVDAAQLVAHRPVHMARSGIDLLAFSAHKMYAPFGSGALVARKGLLKFDDATWAKIRASGEENAAGIAALGKAIVFLQRIGMDVIEEHERALTRRLLEGLADIPGMRVYGMGNPRSPRFPDRGGVVAISLSGVPHNVAARELAEEEGIGVRQGCFCAHILVRHMVGIPPLVAHAAALGVRLFPTFMGAALPGLVRVSLGLQNNDYDVDRFLRALRRIAARPRPIVDRLLAALHAGTPFDARRGSGDGHDRMAAYCADAIDRVFSDTFQVSDDREGVA